MDMKLGVLEACGLQISDKWPCDAYHGFYLTIFIIKLQGLLTKIYYYCCSRVKDNFKHHHLKGGCNTAAQGMAYPVWMLNKSVFTGILLEVLMK